VSARGETGNLGVELLLVGLVLPLIVVQLGLGAFAGQRASLAAQQLAREAVRFAATGRYNQNVEQLLKAQIATELGVAPSEVAVTVASTAAPNTVSANARVAGATETAVMRVQK